MLKHRDLGGDAAYMRELLSAGGPREWPKPTERLYRTRRHRPGCFGVVMTDYGPVAARDLYDAIARGTGTEVYVVDALHPTGKCQCSGEGTCSWCAEIETLF